MIYINDNVSIPDDEIVFEVSTSSGPGGQHVNRVQTRVTLLFDVGESRALGEADRTLIQERLATRISKAGVLRVRSDRHRSQAMNRDDARQRFIEMLSIALKEDAPRKKTRVSRAVKKRRLDEKKRRSKVKKRRGPYLDQD
jgi:ribosome-associated protein